VKLPTKFKLIEALDQYLTRDVISLPGKKPSFWPTEASVVVGEEEDKHVIGTCIRASYFRHKSPEIAEKPSARSEYIFAWGHIIEDFLTEKFKEMGIWYSNSVRVAIPEYGVSGEIDILLKLPNEDKPHLAECKTYYGYNATKEIMGNKSYAGSPRDSNLLQILLYLYATRGKLMDYGRLIYFARDNPTNRREFIISLHKEDGKHWPVIDGSIDYRFCVEDILNRYKELKKYIDSDTIPPNDFELIWNDKKVEREYKRGNVSKTKYLAWQKGKETVGDWACSYCSMQTTCWGDKQ